MNIAICDDEKEQASYLRKLITQWAQDNSFNVSINEYNSAEAFLFNWERYKYDIALLDIEMGGQNGIVLAQELRQSDERLIIIFATAFDEFFSDGYDVSALHYLLKPVSAEKLREVLNRAREKLTVTPRMIVFASTDGNIRVKADDILYAEIFSHYVDIHTTIAVFNVKSKMSDLENQLGEGFIRCHRSYIAGLAHVEKITRTEICLNNSITLPLSRALYDAANKAFIEYNFKKA